MSGMGRGVNRAERVAETFLSSIEGKPMTELSDLQYLARIGARAVIFKRSANTKWRANNVAHMRDQAKKWKANNPERAKRNNRITVLRSSIEKLTGKPASKKVDWPSRLAAYEQELAQLLESSDG